MTQTNIESIICKLLFASALLLLVGCQREAFECMDDNRPNPDGSMRFSLKTEDAEKETDQLQTRGTPRNSLEGYQTVSVDVFSHTSDYEATSENDVEFLRNVLLEQKESNWKYTPSLFWPAEKKLSFIAYASDIPFAAAGISFLPTAEAPKSIEYQVPDSVTKQPDLLVTTKFNQTKVNNVTLTMKHALACVSFCGIAPEGSTYVKSITLRNVYSKGKLTLNDPSMAWAVDPDSKGVTVFEAGIKKEQELGKDPLPDNNYLMTEDGYLMMIPQKLKDAAIDVLYWNKKDDTENKVITYMLPVDNESYATWKPGLKYIYKFGNQSAEDITVVYYEKYADNKGYGLYYYNKGILKNTIIENGAEIIEAGYGVLSKKAVEDATQIPIRLITDSSDPVSSGSVVDLQDIGFLYPVDQSGGSTFTLPTSSTPVDVYFNNSNKPCGMIVPLFAKGVYAVKMDITNHAIRTPQQMRNITALGRSSERGHHTYKQELDLDFSKKSIGGGELSAAVVACEFNDWFKGQKKRIENVKINATNTNGALFYSNGGVIENIILKNSSISSSGNAGGIAATNEATGEIIRPQIIGENNSDKMFIVRGTSGYVGAIAGLNYGKITGNNIDEEVATELPVAEVSGWALIEGMSQAVGGITGQNEGTITTCLVNGVHVTGPNRGDVEIAKITIKGGPYVGGITGVNKNLIVGNYSAKNGAEPDLAGIVSITGTGNYVGGIAGGNSGILNQVNIRLGRGDGDNAITITGKESVGGIVGFNDGGTLKADGDSFISVRGNVIISGIKDVGGIVGNNGLGSISNCFVYNFYSQVGQLTHHAPKITGETNVGGIVGYSGLGTIKQCAVFSTVSATNAGGDDVKNARAEINAKSGAGGIAGHGFSGLTISQCFVLGNVQINGETKYSGGIVGENNVNTTITSVHVGNSGTAVSDIYRLFDKVKLPVRDSRMKTGGNAMTHTSGTPTIVGGIYVGGICGVNWGTVKEVSIMDNIHIGTSSSDFVGGVVGGNGVGATIQNCKTYNPTGITVIIEGDEQVGGIVGLNNGRVTTCQLGLPGKDQQSSLSLITIQGRTALGGIAGTNGGHLSHGGTGNETTKIESSNVYGKVLIKTVFGDNWDWYRVGGIVGENGPTNSVIGCSVIGYASGGLTPENYDVRVQGSGTVGGIAGANYGHIYGTPLSYSTVTNTAVIATHQYAGGLVGILKSNKDSTYEATLYYCAVSEGVLIHDLGTHSGAFAGQIEGVGATQTTPTLFGTSPEGPKNKIYRGTSNPVIISGNHNSVKPAPPIGDFVFPAAPPTQTNLWADYQMWNYLYYD